MALLIRDSLPDPDTRRMKDLPPVAEMHTFLEESSAAYSDLDTAIMEGTSPEPGTQVFDLYQDAVRRFEAMARKSFWVRHFPPSAEFHDECV